MLVYDWMWWGQLTNQNLVQRCAEGCTEVCGGAQRGVRRCAEGCAEVHGGARRGAQRCTEGCVEVRGGGGGKNQDFMFILFLNAGV